MEPGSSSITLVDSNSVMETPAAGLHLKNVNMKGPLSTFTCFAQLPAELRLKIWHLACSVTRNVSVVCKEINTRAGQDPTVQIWEWIHPYYFHSYTLPPPILGVCRESRREGLRNYTLDFKVEDACSDDDIDDKFPFSAPAKIYINWNTDRVCIFDPWTFEARLTDGSGFTCRLRGLRDLFTEKKLRYLAIGKFWEEQLTHDIIPMSPENSHFEEVIMYQGQRHESSFYRPGGIRFETVASEDKEALSWLCYEMYRAVEDFCDESGDAFEPSVTPMPFNLRVADIHFERQGDIMRSDTATDLICMGDKGVY